MDKVEEISIQIRKDQTLTQIVISPVLNKVMVNGTVNEILSSTIERLYSIIRTWKENYSGSILENRELFKIVIKEKEKSYCMAGAGAYPDNYSEFKEWLGDIGVRNLL